MQKFTIERAVGRDDPPTACDFLAQHTGLSKTRIKDAMNKGAVWHQKGKGKPYRLRRATAAIEIGDNLSIHYDAKLLALSPQRPDCISDQHRYSIWYKPAGMITQGNKFGDHCALLRQVELHFKPRREVYPVHRLDREASGILLIAHDKKSAGLLSGLFVSQQINKHYRARVLGNLADRSPKGRIEQPLDGKPAVTEYVVRGYDPVGNFSSVEVTIHTGRKHQIRRHFESIGFPVIGDPLYGSGNKNKSGLKLAATSLQFCCPIQGKNMVFESPQAGFDADI